MHSQRSERSAQQPNSKDEIIRGKPFIPSMSSSCKTACKQPAAMRMKGSSGVIRGFMRNEGISSSATGAAALTDALPWALVGDAAAALCGDGADIGTAPTSLYLRFAAAHMGHTSPDSFELAD
jgi:hypothetical protein